MKWFKHDTDANQDAKLQNVLLDYGLEGYGLYWYCIELIAGKLDKDNFTFELEHDARIIARNVGSTPQKVEEMMKYFIAQGLFENNENTITCMKLAKRLDQSMTSNFEMRSLINNLKNHDGVMMESCSSHDGVMREENRRDQKRKEKRESAREACATPIVFSNSEIEILKKWAESELNENFNFELELKKFIEYAEANGKEYKNLISAAKMNLRKQAQWAGLDKPSRHTQPVSEKFKIESEIKSLEILLAQQKKSKSTPPLAIESTERKIKELKNALESA